MAGMNTSPNSSLALLREGLPDLQIIQQYTAAYPVKFHQRVNIGLRRSSASDFKMLRTHEPTIHIQGLAKFHGNRLRLRVALETTSQDKFETPARVFWKVALVKDNAYEEIGEKSTFLKLPPQHMTTQSEDYLEMKMQDIRPNFIENMCVQFEWEARLVWFHDGIIADPFHKVVFCCHQVCDILDKSGDRSQLQEQVEQEMAQEEVAGLQFRE